MADESEAEEGAESQHRVEAEGQAPAGSTDEDQTERVVAEEVVSADPLPSDEAVGDVEDDAVIAPSADEVAVEIETETAGDDGEPKLAQLFSLNPNDEADVVVDDTSAEAESDTVDAAVSDAVEGMDMITGYYGVTEDQVSSLPLRKIQLLPYLVSALLFQQDVDEMKAATNAGTESFDHSLLQDCIKARELLANVIWSIGRELDVSNACLFEWPDHYNPSAEELRENGYNKCWYLRAARSFFVRDNLVKGFAYLEEWDWPRFSTPAETRTVTSERAQRAQDRHQGLMRGADPEDFTPRVEDPDPQEVSRAQADRKQRPSQAERKRRRKEREAAEKAAAEAPVEDEVTPVATSSSAPEAGRRVTGGGSRQGTPTATPTPGPVAQTRLKPASNSASQPTPTPRVAQAAAPKAPTVSADTLASEPPAASDDTMTAFHEKASDLTASVDDLLADFMNM